MERVRYTAQRGISLRRIFTFVLAAFVSVLLATTIASHSTSAQTGDAQWKGESIVYSGQQYFPTSNATANDSRGLEEGTIIYQSTDEPSGSSSSRQARIIYFAPGTSPPTATSATFAIYDLTGQNQYSNARNQQSVVIVPAGQSTSGVASSCSVDGIGWIVCPVTVFLAEAMDNIYNWIADFVEVRPVSINDTNTPLYVAWNVMRSIANVAFIIAFLIIIYSQLTGAGVSNYGLKKLLPRLIIAAILVNLSFLIAAIAVDLSNIAGYGLQQIMISIRENTFAITNQTLNLQEDSNPWLAVTEFVLSGGATALGVGALAIGTAGSAGAAIYTLLPLLLGFVLTVLFVLLILAARQAIIIILIVISPLAFVANLLPNTEKWFDRWRDLFMTMLIFFPAFSLVFGGSQLAGGIIVQNATNLIMIIFGLAVQVAPLLITPLLLKLSGGLLGRIAGIINDPRKGLMDRTKNWANESAAVHRNKSLQKNPGQGFNLMRRTAQRLDRNQQYRKRAISAYEASKNANALEQDMDRYQPLYGVEKSAEMRQATADDAMKIGVQNRLNDRSHRLHIENARMEAGKRALETSVQISASDIEEYRAGQIPTGAAPDLAASIRRLDASRQSLYIEKTRAGNAESIAHEQIADALIRDEGLRKRAGGIDFENGADASLANAISTVRESYGKSINEARQIIKHFNLSSEQRQDLAMGRGPFTITREDGSSRTFTNSDLFAREAAVEDQIATGTVPQVEELVMNSGKELKGFQTTIADAVAKNGLGGKTLYLGGKTIDDIAQGRFKDATDLSAAVLETIGKGKISEKDLSSIDKDAVAQLLKAAQLVRDGGQLPSIIDPVIATKLPEQVEIFSELARHTLLGDERVNVKPNSRALILQIAQLTDPNFTGAPLVTEDERKKAEGPGSPESRL